MLTKYSAVITVSAMMLAVPASARLTFTQRLQQKAGAKVQLRQDKDIDLLVNGREADPVVVTTPTAKPVVKTNQATTQRTATTTPARTNTNSLMSKPEPAATTATTPARVNAGKSTAYTTRAGWRVKFFTGGSSRVDKENAQAAGREFKRQFPETPVYMHFVSPHWICVAGDFVNKEDADAFIAKVRSTGQFNTAGMTVMKSRVKVPVE